VRVHTTLLLAINGFITLQLANAYSVVLPPPLFFSMGLSLLSRASVAWDAFLFSFLFCFSSVHSFRFSSSSSSSSSFPSHSSSSSLFFLFCYCFFPFKNPGTGFRMVSHWCKHNLRKVTVGRTLKPNTNLNPNLPRLPKSSDQE